MFLKVSKYLRQCNKTVLLTFYATDETYQLDATIMIYYHK